MMRIIEFVTLAVIVFGIAFVALMVWAENIPMPV